MFFKMLLELLGQVPVMGILGGLIGLGLYLFTVIMNPGQGGVS